MRRLLFLLPCSLVLFFSANGQQPVPPSERVVTFRFVSGNDMFYAPWGGNGEELKRLYALIDEYRPEIIAKRVPVHVDSYCASLSTTRGNTSVAFTRANRVKSELITRKGLLEEHFITRNFPKAHEGSKDVVVVTLRVPVKPEPKPEPRPEPRPEPKPQPKPEPEPKPEPRPEPEPQPAPVVEKQWKDPYGFALRTNLLHDALLAPTLGIEWRVSPAVGLKVDGSFSQWGDEKGKVQKLWLVNPELRWYTGNSRRFYLGLGGNYSEFNVFKNMIGSLFPDDTGYQGTLYNGGVTVGYQARLSNSFSLDFNLGLGYTNLEYDSFNLINQTRVYKGKNQTKEFWGPTQAGINLVWRLGGK